MNFVVYVLGFIIVSANAKVASHDQPISDTVLDNFIGKDDKTKDKDSSSIFVDNKDTKLNPSDANEHVSYTVKTSTENTPVHKDDDFLNNTIDSEPYIPQFKVDNGTALILTPYIEEGRIEEARKACRVDSDVFLGVESYSGFLTVNKTYDSNLFFWYFPIQNKAVKEEPWIIWLQGGPGASSLTGLFDEIGPFKFAENQSLVLNPFTWLQNHSLVFIDNPVGTGYSFTMHEDGFTTDMATYGLHLHTAVKQLVQLFPELREAPLYVAGESYAGKYVPALGIEIHRHKEEPSADINLKGLIIGNAYVDPAMISQLTRPFYYFGLLQQEQLDIVQPLVDSFQRNIANNDSVSAKNNWNNLVSVLLILSHQKHAYNFLRDDLFVGKYAVFLKRSEVKRALHVGDIQFGFVNFTVNIMLAPDFLSTAKPLFEELLDQYKVLTYCGQLDQMLPCVFTSENYRTWKWNASQHFVGATRLPFMHDNRLSGYVKSGGRLTEVVVRGAGHMAPLDAPAPTQSLVARWTHAQPLASTFSILENIVLRDFIRNNSNSYYL